MPLIKRERAWTFTQICALSILFASINALCQADSKKVNLKPEDYKIAQGPKSITRNIIQDNHGDICIAAFDGIFFYENSSFRHVTEKVSSARFFSILQDRKGHYWFGSIGSGVYQYDGHSFKNFTTADGLLNNEVGCIYDSKVGHIWFGVSGGVSCYDGLSFRNFIIDGDKMYEDMTDTTFQDRQPLEVNSILEDKLGRIWLATRGHT